MSTFKDKAKVIHAGRGIGAFTLVELLVVIGIVATLIAMLLPALAKARQSAQQVRCASNLRSIGQAITLFANQNDGRSPGGGNRYVSGSSSSFAWQEVLSAEIFQKANSVPRMTPFTGITSNPQLVCPVMSDTQKSSIRSYGINAEIASPYLFAPPFPSYAKLVDNPQQRDGTYVKTFYSTWTFTGCSYYLGAKMSKWHNPAQKFLVWDSEKDGAPANALATLSMGDSASFSSFCAGTGTFAFRHSNYKRFNMMFLDGHVEAMQFDQNLLKPVWFDPST